MVFKPPPPCVLCLEDNQELNVFLFLYKSLYAPPPGPSLTQSQPFETKLRRSSCLWRTSLWKRLCTFFWSGSVELVAFFCLSSETTSFPMDETWWRDVARIWEDVEVSAPAVEGRAFQEIKNNEGSFTTSVSQTRRLCPCFCTGGIRGRVRPPPPPFTSEVCTGIVRALNESPERLGVVLLKRAFSASHLNSSSDVVDGVFYSCYFIFLCKRESEMPGNHSHPLSSYDGTICLNFCWFRAHRCEKVASQARCRWPLTSSEAAFLFLERRMSLIQLGMNCGTFVFGLLKKHISHCVSVDWLWCQTCGRANWCSLLFFHCGCTSWTGSPQGRRRRSKSSFNTHVLMFPSVDHWWHRSSDPVDASHFSNKSQNLKIIQMLKWLKTHTDLCGSSFTSSFKVNL